MSIDFRSDPIGQRIKGWKAPPNSPRTRLVAGWEPRPEFGSGQEMLDPGLGGDPGMTAEDLIASQYPLPTPEPTTELPPPPPYASPPLTDWGAARAAAFPEQRTPAQKPDPGLPIHRGGLPVAARPDSVYDPPQARTLSSSAPKPAIARPPGGSSAVTASSAPTASGSPGAAGPAPARSQSQQEFVANLLPTAQAMAKQLGIPWQVLMAIPANETGWGSSVFHNNLFGIKGPGAAAKTWEVINGRRVDITDSFRTFDSPEAAMRGFAELMQNKRYEPAMQVLQDDPTNWPGFIQAIHKAGYATDPQWTNKIVRIGQGLESADSMPTAGMSRVTPAQGGIMGVAAATLGGRHPSGGVLAAGEGGIIPVVPGGAKNSYWTSGGTHSGGPAADIFAAKGSPIHAPVGGVSQPAVYSLGGNATTIKGDDGKWYYMAHGNVPFVGGRIEAGQQIGEVGDTGNAKGTSPHLHFAIASSPDVFNKRNGSGDINGTPDYWGQGGGTKPGAPAAAAKPTYTDDASYVAWVYRNGLGRNLPSTDSALYATSRPISANEAVPGDLVMFNMNSRDPNEQHVALYAGNGQMIHNNGKVEQVPLWKGGEFRRLQGVKPEDLSRGTPIPGSPGVPATPGAPGTPGVPAAPGAAPGKRVVKYRDNEDGTYTATYTDGTTGIETFPSQLAPIEGGKHPQTIKPVTTRGMGGGQEMLDPGSVSETPATPPAPRPAPRPTVTRGREDSVWTSEGTHGGRPAADIFGDEGQPIRAPVGGNSRAALDPKGGNTTVIEGDDGKFYYLAHGHVPFTGGRIEQGQDIGQVGRSGNALGTDPHVHFAIASDPKLFDKYGGSGDIAGGPEYWQDDDTVGGQMGGGQEMLDPGSSGQEIPWEEQIDPLTGRPRGRPANQVVPEALQALPGAIGGAFDQLGRGAREIVEEPEVRSTRLAQAEEEDRQRKMAEEAARRRPLQPVQGPPEPAPSEPVTPSSPLPSTTGYTPPTVAPPTPSTFGQGATLKPDNPILKQARGEPINPFEWSEAVGRAATQTVLPEDIRKQGVDVPIMGPVTVEDVGTQLLRPDVAINAVAGPGGIAARAGGGVIDQAIGIAAAKLVGAGGRQVGRAAGAVAPAVREIAERAVPPVVREAAERIEPYLRQVSNSPVGKFLVEDGGWANPQMLLAEARRNVMSAAVGGGVGGVMGVLPAVTTDPQFDDPDWWGQVIDDWATGTKTGAAIGVGAGIGIPIAKWGLDKTVLPSVVRGYRALMDPVRNITHLATQEAAGARANGMHLATAESELVAMSGAKLFGKSGQGLNTADAAAHVEKYRTLRGFVAKDGTTPNQGQIDWVAERVKYEDEAGVRLRAAKVLGKTQDVNTPLGDPGPSVHVMHLYEEPVAQAKRKQGHQNLSWKDTQTHGRNKTTDPNATDPNRPITIEEAHALHVADPKVNPKPRDALVERFEVSTYQTERSLANRAFWDKLKPGKKNASPLVMSAKAKPPADWRAAEDGWGFGQGAKQFRFAPELADYLDNVANTGRAQSPVWLQKWGDLWAQPMKQILFASTPVHLFNMAWRTASVLPMHQTAEMFRSYMLPALFKGGVGNIMLGNPALVRRAAGAGMTWGHLAAEGVVPQFGLKEKAIQGVVGGGTSYALGWQQAKARGLSDEEAQKQAWVASAIGAGLSVPRPDKLIKAIGGVIPESEAISLGDIIHHGIFYEALPAMKLGMFDIMTRSGIDDKVAAEMANNNIGGIDLVKTGRAPWVQDLLRYGLIAADWTEGQVRTLAGLALPNEQGAVTRRQVVKSLGTYMAAIEMFNYAINGHFTWQNSPGKEYQLEITGLLDGLAAAKGDPGLASRDDKGAPMRSYIDPMPPMRWAMEAIGEASRQAALTLGQAERGLGFEEQGQRLIERASGDLTKGEVPPDLWSEGAKFGMHRVGPGLASVGAIGELVTGKQFDWTGKPLERPVPEVPSTIATMIAHAAAPSAPAFASAFVQNVDVNRPDRARTGDALIELLGITRVTAMKELSENIQAADQLKRYLGVDAREQYQQAEDHAADVEENERKRKQLYAHLEDASMGKTHAQFDDEMHKLINARQAMTQRAEIKKVSDLAPEWARGGVQEFLERIWSGEGSERAADVENHVDLDALSDAFWHPKGADPRDEKGFKKAQRLALTDLAYENDTDPDVLEDMVKWRAQNQDLATGAVPAIPALPGVSSGKLSEVATGFLSAAELRDKNGKIVPNELIPDIDQRADAQRRYLKEQAAQLGVSPEVLLQRINLRLSRPEQVTPIERSYNRAVQTFFRSKDDEQFPRYRNEDGSAMGTREQWDMWDLQIHDIGQARAARMPEYRVRVAALERGQNAREKFLIKDPNNLDYERWFGFGRSMTEPMWKRYSTGNLVGYDDLASLRGGNPPPKSETINRDKIQELYRASNRQERTQTRVNIWINGATRSMPLASAARYARHFQRNTSGRTLEDLAAHDELDPQSRPPGPGSTVGATTDGQEE